MNICPNPNNNPKCSLNIKGNKTCKSCSLFGKKRPADVGKKISQIKKGKPLTEEHKQKIKENANPYIRTEEHRRIASENNKGERNYFYGKGFLQKGELNNMFNTNLYKKWIEKYDRRYVFR